MASDQSKVLFNTRERLLSSEVTKLTDLVNRNLQESLQHLYGGYSGVVRGLTITATGSTMVLTIAAGFGLLVDTGKSYPDSQHRWIELLQATTATVDTADPTNPRWDVVEIAPGVSTTTASRDVFNTATGAFAPQTLSKEDTSSPTITIRKGTAAATPVLPAGATGKIPLAYIYVAAATTSIAQTDVVACRPLLAPGMDDPVDFRGGGVCVATATSATMSFRPMVGRLPGSAVRLNTTGLTISSSSVGFDTGTTFPTASDGTLYVYIIEPPYPAGYDATVAPREFVHTGTRVPTGGVNSSGGIIMVSSTAPKLTDAGQGAFNTASLTLNDAAFASTATLSAQSAYLGAVRVLASSSDWRFQNTVGDRIRIDNTSPALSEVEVVGGGGSSGGTGNFRKANPFAASGATLLPTTSYRFEIQVMGDTTSSGDITFYIREPVPATLDSYKMKHKDVSAVTQDRDQLDVWSDDGTFTWNVDNIANGCEATIVVWGYTDYILSLR